MAKFEFRLPDIGEGVSEGEVVAWLVKQGDQVNEDQPMVEVMTDKATVTIGAPKPGQIAELLAAVGEKVPVGKVLVVIDVDDSRVSGRPGEHRAQAAPSTPPRATTASAVGDIRESLPGAGFFTKTAASRTSSTGNGTHASSQEVQESVYFTEKPLASPATRKLARDMNVDLRRVQPSGPGGRVLKKDLLAFSDHKQPSPLLTSLHAEDRTTSHPKRERVEERRPFVGIRRVIAERMQKSKNTAAHFTFVEECRADRLIATRERLKPLAESEGVKLTYLPFIIKATEAALRKHPELNSTLDESKNEWVLRSDVHIGVATATPHGLLVPVIKDVDGRSVLDLAREIERISNLARQGRLAPSDLQGSTFTVTSLGQQGGFLATPVLNYPEVGILGVHQIKRRPVVSGDEIVIGQVMMLSLSFDHRIIDGHVGAAFTYELINYLEEPERLLLELA